MNATSLLLRCREGDISALEEFARRYQLVIERLALAILDDGQVENVVEAVRIVVRETLLAAVAAGGMFRDESDLLIWLYAKGIQNSRKQQRQQNGKQAKRILATSAGSDSRVRPASHQALYQLEEKLRLPLLLHYSSGLSLEQVGLVLRISPLTVQARMAQGREQMRTLLEEA